MPYSAIQPPFTLKLREMPKTNIANRISCTIKQYDRNPETFLTYLGQATGHRPPNGATDIGMMRDVADEGDELAVHEGWRSGGSAQSNFRTFAPRQSGVFQGTCTRLARRKTNGEGVEGTTSGNCGAVDDAWCASTLLGLGGSPITTRLWSVRQSILLVASK